MEDRVKGSKLIVCFSDKEKDKSPITLENPETSYLKKLNEDGYGIFMTANSFFATQKQLEELAIIKGKRKVTKRNKEFLNCLNEVFGDLDVCKDQEGMDEEEREKRKKDLKDSIEQHCPASSYIITKNGLQPRWWIKENNTDQNTQDKYVNVMNGIIEWSKLHGSKGDPVKDVTRVLRVAGYYHQKSEPYLITEEKGNEKIYTLDELKKYFWFESKIENLSNTETKNEDSINYIDSIDIKDVVINVWNELGQKASFDKDDHLIINGEMTATFKGRKGGNYIATTSSDYPAKGNAITYVAETLKISTKEAYKWLCDKYPKKNNTEENKTTSLFVSAMTHAELISKEFPSVRYTIEPFFEQGTMNMVSAPPNTWKSWLLFLFAGHIVNGTLVFNKFATEKTNVMIINEEDSARLVQDRLKLLNIINPSLPIFYRIAQGSKLEEDFVNNLIIEAKEKNIGVIMFDSLRAVHDAEENSSTEMQKVLDQLKKIVRENITVIFTHHHRKKTFGSKNDDADSTRGTSAINASISGHISLEEVNKEERYLIVRHLKSKVGEKLLPFEIEIQVNDIVSFNYRGEHEPKEKALTESKTKIINALRDREELLSRKDFIHFEIGGATTIKEATNFLVKNNEIKEITRKEAEKRGLKSLTPGKGNEKLYYIEKEGDDFDIWESNAEDKNLFDDSHCEDP